MFRRRLAQATMAMAMLLTAVFAAAPPASAAVQTVTYRHSGGSGAIAVAVRFDFYWTNRSAVILNPSLYVKSGECGLARFAGYTAAGDGLFDEEFLRQCNFTGVNQYFDFPTFTLSGSCCIGGVQQITVYVEDQTHGGRAFGGPYRK